jgi:hypothetical protein
VAFEVAVAHFKQLAAGGRQEIRLCDRPKHRRNLRPELL